MLELLPEPPEVLLEPEPLEPEPPVVAEPPLVPEPPVLLELPVVVLDGAVLVTVFELVPVAPVVLEEGALVELLVVPVGPVGMPDVSVVPDDESVLVEGPSTGLPHAETSAAQKVSNRGRIGKSVLMIDVA